MYLGINSEVFNAIFNNGAMDMYDYDTLENLEVQLEEVHRAAKDICNDGRMNLSEKGFDNIRNITYSIEQAIAYLRTTFRLESESHLYEYDD